jgi:2,4-dienoyl-CoA reductase (NADPH2)
MQILHTGRYAYHRGAVAPSAVQAPISPIRPRELSEEDIERTLNDYARCAGLAQLAGYDGVEVMGSEGYLINQFIAQQTNFPRGRLGRQFREPHPLRRRIGSARARGDRAQLHHHFPPVDARPGRRRQHLG